MTRKEKILAYVQTKNKAVTTKEIADDLGILRNNVSKELNVLVRAGKLSKLAGRPVKYQSLAAETDTLIPQTGSKMPDPAEPVLRPSIFDTMIGQKDSLKTQIEQAKAAILYPPHGLNVLITGPTGSGKTYFANAMHQFAVNQAMIENKKIGRASCRERV